MASKVNRPDWTALAEPELLQMRICDLGLGLEDTRVRCLYDQVLVELEERGFRFKPHMWISDEWFTPDGVPGFAVPFYLAHEKLKRLELRMMYEVEGGNRASCLKILRHEVGHAIDNAYMLRRRKRRKELFGDPKKPYPDYYSPKPLSKNYVLHLDNWYAQSHPDEDFAETFAVWLATDRWRERYHGWGALKKLEYMDDLMGEICEKKPLVSTRRREEPVSRIKTTLGEYYEEKRQRYEVAHPSVFDEDLMRLFSATPKHRRTSRASVFLNKMRRDIRSCVADWTGTHAYTIDQVIRDMTIRCRELGLRLTMPEDHTLLNCTVMLTVQTMSYLQTGRHRIAM